MDAFTYLSVLLSIIIGLAIAQVLQGYRAILLARKNVRLSASVLIWSGLLLLFAAQAWWASFDLRQRHTWDFMSFAVILLQMVMLYMLAAVVFPDVAPGSTVDLVEHSEKHRRIFFGFLLGMLAVSMTKDIILDHRLASPTNLAFHLLFAALSVAGFLMKSMRAQLLLAVAAVVVFLAYIAVLFSAL